MQSSRRSSVTDRVFDLFDEYAAAYARGERPSAEEYLDRAGSDRDQLASLLDEYLRRAPAQPATEDDKRYLGLMLAQEPPLLQVRVERGLRVDEVVGLLVERLELDSAKWAKVKRYYQRLEGGLLDPSGLSRRLRSALADILGPSAERALDWTAPPAAAAPLFLREAEHVESLAEVTEPAAGAKDEIDRLFTGGE
jgi:hypothetical protein